MGILTSEEVAYLQSLHASAHRDTCQIRQSVQTPDGFGGYTDSWPSVTQTVACTSLDRGGSAAGQGGILDVMTNAPSKTFVMERGTNVLPSWRITWVERSITYEVADVEQAGSYGPAVYCQCVEL